MRVLGIIGDHRVSASLSPVMHNGVFRNLGLSGMYLRFPAAPGDLGQLMAEISKARVAGCNVTVPHKQAVMSFLAGMSEEAASLGAVNTLVRTNKGYIGHNTDMAGFVEAVNLAGLDIRGKRALIIGAGGAARAVALGLMKSGAGLVQVANRSPHRAKALSGHISGVEVVEMDQMSLSAGKASLIVNATSISLPEESADMAKLAAGLKPGPGLEMVVDINYGRSHSIWRDLALRGGARFLDGLDMLVNQARLSFRLWTGINVEAHKFAAQIRSRS